MLKHSQKVTVAVMGVMIAMAFVSRFMIDLPNFKPVGGFAILSGMMFSTRLRALAVPLIAMLFSDLYFGMAELWVTLSVYAALGFNVLLGRWLLQRWQKISSLPSRLLAAGSTTILASIQFFLLTNFSVWAGTSWYPRTWVGLVDCFLNALPFFRFTFAGDLLFAGLPLVILACCLAYALSISKNSHENTARVFDGSPR